MKGRHSVRKISFLLLAALSLILCAGLAVGSDQEDGGTIVFTKPVKAVIFDHKIHTSQGLDCDSCHDSIFAMETGAAEAKDDFTMASLYAGKYCGSCHDGKTAFASNTRCSACHIGVKGHNRLTGGDKNAAKAAHH